MAGRRDGADDASGGALIEFLDEAMQRGLLSPQTGADYILTCKDILAFVVGENWPRTDMTTLDMDELRRRLTATKGNRQSSRFDEHFLPAIDAFRTHLRLARSSEGSTILAEPVPTPVTSSETNGGVPKHRTAPVRRRRLPASKAPPITTQVDPLSVLPPGANTKGDAKRMSRKTRAALVEPTLPGASSPTPDISEVPIVASSAVLPSFGVIPHLFPLRDGMLATLLLPADLTVREAQRLTAFIESLALPDGPDISNVVANTDSNGAVAPPQSPPQETPAITSS